ncbi:SDR family oxidoreductase [Jeotgalibaca sp. A127]|uniref:SDR family oxidoreductase n=1 Tax=Jeotgalibaca sp. A127 TaxID=3457324 RepID=UPI003FCF9A5E
MKYLLTGATGGFGTYALSFLKQQVALENIVVLARSEAKAAPFREQGIETRIADFADYDSLFAAFAGIDRMLFVSSQPGEAVSRGDQHKNVVAAAKETGIGFIAYTSFPNATKSTSPLAQDHILTETLLKESGIPHTFLRNNWYFENEMATYETALNGGAFTYSAEDGRVGWALKKEYAEAAVNVLTGKFLSGEVLELGGPLITYADLAAALRVATGKKFRSLALDDGEYQNDLKVHGVPAESIAFVMMIQRDIREGQLAIKSNDLEKVLGRPAKPATLALKELLASNKESVSFDNPPV